MDRRGPVKKAIAYLEQHPAFWESLTEKPEDITYATEDDRWAAADIPILLTNWEKARRCVIYREAHETERTTDDQLTMTLTTYSFQAIVTNTDLKPLPLLRSYNQRANIENRIDELKEGYAVEQNSQHSMLRNLLFSWIKVIAYNVMVWFKQTLMPEPLKRCEVQTIRRMVIRVPGNVVVSTDTSTSGLHRIRCLLSSSTRCSRSLKNWPKNSCPFYKWPNSSIDLWQ